MSAASTRAPSLTNTNVDAFAIPEPAPVMTADLPSSRPMANLPFPRTLSVFGRDKQVSTHLIALTAEHPVTIVRDDDSLTSRYLQWARWMGGSPSSRVPAGA